MAGHFVHSFTLLMSFRPLNTFFKYDWSKLDIIDVHEGKTWEEREKKRQPDQELLLHKPFITQGLWQVAEKKANFMGFSETNSLKKMADFAGISWKNSSQILPKNDR